jgi:hypothetical protein
LESLLGLSSIEIMNAYESRRARWLKLGEYLPSELKGRIALRNLRAAATLSLQAQQTLACALDAGLGQASVIHTLKDNPEVTLDEIIRQTQRKRESDSKSQALAQDFTGKDISEDTSGELAALIQTCFPGWNRLAAESLAVDPLTAELRALLHTWRVCLDSDRSRSETFTVLLCGFIMQAAQQINEMLNSHPNLRAALQTSRVAWFFNSFNPKHEEHTYHP